MVGMREAHEEKPKPETKKKTAVAIRDLFGDELANELDLVILTGLIFQLCWLPVTGYQSPVFAASNKLLVVFPGDRKPVTGDWLRQ